MLAVRKDGKILNIPRICVKYERHGKINCLCGGPSPRCVGPLISSFNLSGIWMSGLLPKFCWVWLMELIPLK